MPSSELLIAFLITTAIFAYIPGPAMLYAAAQTIARGRRAGLMASLGIHLGCYVHVIAAAAGLSMLFHAVPMLYMLVKLAGAELPDTTYRVEQRTVGHTMTCSIGASLVKRANSNI